MAQPLRCGQIVWAEVADENGVRKARPAVLVTPDDRLAAPEFETGEGDYARTRQKWVDRITLDELRQLSRAS